MSPTSLPSLLPSMSPTILLLNNSLSQVNISSSTVIEEDKDESNNISGLYTVFTIIGVLTTVIFIIAVSLKKKNNKKNNNNIKIEENTGNLMYNHFNSCNTNNSSKYDNQYLQPTLIDTTYSDILYSSDNVGYEIPNYNISDENYNNLNNSTIEFDSINASDNQLYNLASNDNELIEDNNLYDLAANDNLYDLANNYIDVNNK